MGAAGKGRVFVGVRKKSGGRECPPKNVGDRNFMKNRGMKIKHPKLRGEWAELRFMTRAAEHGLCVTKPWGETARYDFAVEHEGHFVRVQVKSTMFKDRGGYSCTVRGCRGPYEGDPFDFLAAYLIPVDMWYIIPAERFSGQGSIALYPQLKKAKYGPYKEAWHLLRGSVVDRIEACAGDEKRTMAPVLRSHQELCGASTLSKSSMGGTQNDVKLLGDGSGSASREGICVPE